METSTCASFPTLPLSNSLISRPVVTGTLPDSFENDKSLHNLPQPSNTGTEENESIADDTESLDSNSSSKKDLAVRSVVARNSSRGVTMQTLLQEGVLEPGPAVLSIEYLGQKYSGDLLPNGKIVWDNTQFASPSSWATHIKKQINPSKKSGCGWNSVKYKGKKLDKLKSNWFRKFNVTNTIPGVPTKPIEDDKSFAISLDSKINQQRKTIKAAELKLKPNIDLNTFVEYELYDEAAGKSQPFSVMVAASVLLLVDFHSHMTTSEVMGYLGGKWDPLKKCLYIMQAFPCRCKLYDPEVAALTEQEISNSMSMRGLLRVGWYHSHPYTPMEPTVRDIDVQFEMQLMCSAHPTIALICGPYDARESSRVESVFEAFWVTTPLEVTPDSQWYGLPMKISYNEIAEQSVQQDLPHELNQVVEFYKRQPNFVTFKDAWRGSMTFVEKIKLSLQRKISKDNTGNQFLHFVHGLLSNASKPAT